jgi:hypothetical protein
VDLPALVCTRRGLGVPASRRPRVAASVGFAPPAPAGTGGLLTGNDFWASADASNDAEFVLAVVPAQADPEAAMARVRALT